MGKRLKPPEGKQERSEDIREEASRYLRAHKLLTELRQKYLQRRVTGDVYASVRRRALEGDVDGAVRELAASERWP